MRERVTSAQLDCTTVEQIRSAATMREVFSAFVRLDGASPTTARVSVASVSPATRVTEWRVLTLTSAPRAKLTTVTRHRASATTVSDGSLMCLCGV
eukprot:3940850-Rhodomonas_salina.2